MTPATGVVAPLGNVWAEAAAPPDYLEILPYLVLPFVLGSLMAVVAGRDPARRDPARTSSTAAGRPGPTPAIQNRPAAAGTYTDRPANAGERALASAVNWLSAVAIMVLLVERVGTRTSAGMLGGPLAVAVLAAGGCGPGELLARTRVLDAVRLGRLGARQVFRRVLAMLLSAYACAVTGWVVGSLVATRWAGDTGGVTDDDALGAAFAAALTMVVLFDPACALLVPGGVTPWDRFAGSVVCRRRRGRSG